MSLAEQLLRASADGLIAFDRQCRYVSWNAAMERISGIPASVALGRVAFELFPYLKDTGEEMCFLRALDGESSISRDRPYFVRESGRQGTFDAHYLPWRDDAGTIVGGIAVVRETTAQKLAEQQLRETESRFRNMADVAPVLLWMSGTDSLCTFFNQTWLDFTGRSLEQEWGVGWAEGVHFEDFQRCVDTYEAAFNKRQIFEMEYRLRRHDGLFRWILDRGTPRYTPDGSFAGYIGSCVDITERKELEALLRRAVATRDEFLSIASHELRTPLSALRLQADGMMRLVEKGSPPPLERSERAWHMVQGGVERLEQLVTNLLDVSKMGTSGPTLNLESVDLAQIARDVCERFGEQLDSSGCVMSVRAPAHVFGRWDRMRLEQIMTNLLTNAIKYGRGKPIEVGLEADATTARLHVRDHGIGIAPEDHARIFDRFERAVSSSSYGGLGLGLWIAKQIVEALGGEITLVSTRGEGATFSVLLPKGSS
jgi:PAS domain S-box-containing protein